MSKPYRDDPIEKWRKYCDELEKDNESQRLIIAQLKAQRPPKWTWLSKLWSSFWSEHTFNCILVSGVVAVFIGAIVLGAYATWMALSRSGVVRHCYVRRDDDVFVLRGSLDWETDRYMGKFSNMEDAAKAAQLHNCPLR